MIGINGSRANTFTIIEEVDCTAVLLEEFSVMVVNPRPPGIN